MRRLNGLSAHRWILLAIALALIATHGLVLRYAAEHMALSTTAVSGLFVLVLIKHLGWLGALYAWLRSRFRADR